MAAFLDFVRARLAPGNGRSNRPCRGDAGVPAAAEPFGHPPALRLHWKLDRTGGLASSWEPTGHRSRLIPPS